MATKPQRVLCIDPALSVCGWAVLDLKFSQKNTQLPKLVVRRFGMIKSIAVAQRAANRDIVDKYGKTIISLSTLEANITSLIDEFQPDHVVIEDAFYNPKRPAAFASLLQCICTVSMLCYTTYKLAVYRVPTRSAKLSMCGGGAKKQDIINAVLTSDNIVFKQKKGASTLSEHEADAIAVGYHFVLNMLPGITATQAAKSVGVK